MTADLNRPHLDERCHRQVGAARLLLQLLVLPEDVLGNRLHQSLHAALVGRGEPLGSRQLRGTRQRLNRELLTGPESLRTTRSSPHLDLVKVDQVLGHGLDDQLEKEPGKLGKNRVLFIWNRLKAINDPEEGVSASTREDEPSGHF